MLEIQPVKKIIIIRLLLRSEILVGNFAVRAGKSHQTGHKTTTKRVHHEVTFNGTKKAAGSHSAFADPGLQVIDDAEHSYFC